MTTRKTVEKLTDIEFMMMDVHRPLTDEEISQVNPEALVDKSARPFKIVDSVEEGVGAPHEEELSKRYDGPFVKYPDNVEVLDVATSHALEVNRVLQSAFDNNLEQVLVVGRQADGELYMLASDPDIASANLLCDLAKADILDAIKNSRLREKPVEPETGA